MAAVSKPRCARYVWAPYIPMYTTPPILTGFKGSDFVKSFQQLGFVTLKDGDIDQKTVVTLHKWRDNCLAKGVTS